MNDVETKELNDAAIQIQGQVRKNLAKKRVEELKKEQEDQQTNQETSGIDMDTTPVAADSSSMNDVETKELNDAAIQIQGQVRKNLAKKRVEELKKDCAHDFELGNKTPTTPGMNDSDDEDISSVLHSRVENNSNETQNKMKVDIACSADINDVEYLTSIDASTASERSAKLRADAKARRQAEKAWALGEEALQIAASKGYISTTMLPSDIQSENLAPKIKDIQPNVYKSKKKPLYQRIMDNAVVQAMAEENKKIEQLNKYKAIKNGVSIGSNIDGGLKMEGIDQKLKDARDKFIAKEYRYTPSVVDELETPRSPRYIVQEYRNKVSKVSDDSGKSKKVSPLRTRYNIAIKKKIMKQKEDTLNSEIEKLQRIERGKEYSQKVRDFFLPAATNKASNVKSKFNDNAISMNSFQSSIREKKSTQYEENDSYGALPFFQDLMKEYELAGQESYYSTYSKMSGASFDSLYDNDLHQNSELSTISTHNLSPRAPNNSSKNGYKGRAKKHILSKQSSWVTDILQKHDPEEKNLADVYEQGFYVLMLERE
jgi:hypothetical protein